MGISAKSFVEKVEHAYTNKWGYIWATAGELWTVKRQNDLIKKYQSNPSGYSDYQQGAEYGHKWIGKYVADCSGLVKWAANQLGLKGILHGSNSLFNKNCVKTEKIVKGVKIPVGALIFTGDSLTHNHVGILVTPTCVCEAKSTVAGVVHTPLSNKKWTYYGLLKGINYEEAINETVVEKHYPTLRRGCRGEDVKKLQELLAKEGSTLEIDGIFGIGTQSAVRSFQKRHNLVVDGIVGPKTWAELLKNE